MIIDIILIAAAIIITVYSLVHLGYTIGHARGFEEGSRDVLRLYMSTKNRMVHDLDMEEREWNPYNE